MTTGYHSHMVLPRARVRMWRGHSTATLVERRSHHAEILAIEGESYRRRDADLSHKQRQAKSSRR